MVNFSLIIPNYNGREFLPQLFDSLKIAISKCSASKFEIIVIDNNSSDTSIEYLHQIPSIKIIKNHRNLGFATAVNQGIKLSKFNYICLLNTDIILDSLWFLRAYQAIRHHPGYSCFCGTILNKNQIESQGISFEYSGKCIQNHHGEIFIHRPNHYRSVWGSSAAAVIYKKSDLINIGLFDENFFAYIEDVDVAFRLRQNHFKTLLVTGMIANHLGGGTSNKIPYLRSKMTFLNWFKFIKKNFSLSTIIKFFPDIFVERLKNLSYLIKSLTTHDYRH